MKQFDQKANLEKFLAGGDSDVSRNIVGKSVFHRHCGQRMLKIQEYQHYVQRNGGLQLNRRCGNLFYCIKCGENDNNYELG